MKAGIVDYRMGNLASVAKALDRCGAETLVSDRSNDLRRSDLLVLPGVGNFAAGIGNLKRAELADFVREWTSDGRPLLGICLGMQLLFDTSEEGNVEGLGVVPGGVVRLPQEVKVPHMGWNTISASTETFEEASGKRFYFVHSYVCRPSDQVQAATTDYGVSFAAAVEREGLIGVQFHPEKSSADGIALLARLLAKLV